MRAMSCGQGTCCRVPAAAFSVVSQYGMLTERKGEAVLKGDVEALSTPGADVEIISSMIDHIMTLGFAIQRCRNCAHVLVCECFSELKCMQSSAMGAMRSFSRIDLTSSISRCIQRPKNRQSQACASLSVIQELRRTGHQRSGTKP